MVKKNGHGSDTKTSDALIPEPKVIINAPQARAVTIHPDTALQWLEKPSFNVMNRPIRQSDVTNWADIMKRGQWQLNGDAIRISITGKLLDGQHRLWACVEARTPFQSYLIEGLPDEVFDTIDVGKKRSATDMLRIHNKLGSVEMKYENVIMASILTILEYKMGVWKQRHTHVITHHDKIEFLEKNPEIVEWVKKAHVKGMGRWENRHTAGIAAVVFLGSKKFEKKAETFVIGFITGNDLPVGSPIAALRNRLGTTTQLEKWKRMSLITYAWNLHVGNETKIDLRIPSEMPVIAGTEPPIRAKKEPPKRLNINPAIRRTNKAKERAEIEYIKGR